MVTCDEEFFSAVALSEAALELGLAESSRESPDFCWAANESTRP